MRYDLRVEVEVECIDCARAMVVHDDGAGMRITSLATTVRGDSEEP